MTIEILASDNHPTGGLRATYRLQMRGQMDFARATRLVPYFARLGISHLYLSPIFAAMPGSTHGYDVIDTNVIDPVLGSEQDFMTLVAALQEHGLGLILDFVPNHMAAHPFNPWFDDVLRWGADSCYAQHFDIDWAAQKLLLGVLAAPYGAVLENGGFKVEFDAQAGDLQFVSGDLRLPLAPSSYGIVLTPADHEALAQLAARQANIQPDQASAIRRNWSVALSEPDVRRSFDAALEKTNADPSALHAVHEAQVWRLAYWRAARDSLTYRRFFEISDLIGLTVERTETFSDVHHRLLELIAAGHIDGIRLDHIDGLADPTGYLHRLNEVITAARGRPIPTFVEKILEQDESLPASWPVAGTTGYEFIPSLADLMVAPAGVARLTEGYEQFTGTPSNYATIVHTAKREIVSWNLAGELNALTTMLARFAKDDLTARDFGPTTLAEAIIAVITAMPIYRTYIDANEISDADRRILDHAFATAREESRLDAPAVFDFLHRVLTLEFDDSSQRGNARIFVKRFQQTTGPAMAKAVEDTAFYRFNRLISLNEVGGTPDVFGRGIDAFHNAMASRLTTGREAMTATATHDTKRGEDARARIHVLSEMPEIWIEAVDRWSEANRHLRSTLNGRPVPDRNTEWLFYQALAGSWPTNLPVNGEREIWSTLADRMSAFMLKAVREAKVQSSWLRQNKDYENALDAFTRAALDPEKSHRFLHDFSATCIPMTMAGAINSLAATLLKITVPGTPDIYQGTEGWDLSLVDPDNRRPPDWHAMADALQAYQTSQSTAFPNEWTASTTKFFVLASTLAVRSRMPEVFSDGEYIPLQTVGPDCEHVVAFARRHNSDAAITIVPRLVIHAVDAVSTTASPFSDWQDTYVALPETLSSRSWRHAITNEYYGPTKAITCGHAWSHFPVALLCSTEQK